MSKLEETLSPMRKALLERLRSGVAKDAPASASSIPQRDQQKDIPLSFAQQRLWFLDQLEPNNPFYNEHVALRLSGPLKIEALAKSLHSLSQRHEGLRTTFHMQERQPVQVISAASVVPVPVLDLSMLPEARHAQATHQLLQAESSAPFNLEQGPLWRVTLLRLNEHEHLCILVLHHIVADGWSGGVFVRELSACYEAFAQQHVPSLSAMPVQYADFALWQREQAQEEALQEQQRYWARQLDGCIPLELPLDYPRPPQQTFHGERAHLDLPASMRAGLKELSAQEGATLFMLLLAAFNVLLSRYSGQTDIVVGTPIANRNRPELEGIIGFFANTLVLRSDLSGGPTFRQVIQRVRTMALAAFDHQDIPFEELVAALQPERSLSRSPFFQILFNWIQKAPISELQLAHVAITPLEIENKTAKFDLVFEITETSLAVAQAEQGLHVAAEYNTDLFARATITGLLSSWKTLLEGILNSPDARIADLPLVGPQQYQQVVIAWNNTEAAYAQNPCLHQLFERQVDRTPDAVAVCYDDEFLTYAEINRSANYFAAALRSAGVGPNCPVALCLERSLSLLIGLLAILKAGGAYVPLDPAYPLERLVAMLEDSGASLLLTQQSLVGLFPPDTRATRMVMDTMREQPGETDDYGYPERHGTLDDLLYVIYTSGSTGKPKGIAMPHRALVNLLCWQQQHLRAQVGLRTLQFTSLSFDVACQEIFSTWLTGGTLVMIANSVRADPQALAQTLIEQAVERLFLPFVALQQLALLCESSAVVPSTLNEVITAGEQLQVTTAVRWLFAALPACRLYNHYGPAESHVVTAYTLDASSAAWMTLPPIGTPIANTQIYLLSGNMQPTPPGAPGEIYIGGDGLAWGYVGRPESTAERFCPDPFATKPGARLYRTGDLARQRTDGTIDFLGRNDQQVKIRGYRVEPGEIEAVLGQHPAVRECIVSVWATARLVHTGLGNSQTDNARNTALVAYVVPEQGQERLTVGQVRQYLRTTLPDYMLPSFLVVLDAFPLTPSGKVNRRALPTPSMEKTYDARPALADWTPAEEVIAGVYAEILGQRNLAPHDDFFALGGHSLLATQVIIRLRELFHRAIPLRLLFEAPTIAELARHVEGFQRVAAPPPLLPMGQEEMPLSFAQQRLWFLDRLEAGNPAYHIPAPVSLSGTLHYHALRMSLQALAQRHASLRTSLRTRGEEPVQVVQQEMAIALPVIDFSALEPEIREEAVRALSLQEARHPFDLSAGPLWRVTLVRLSPTLHILLLTMHHSIADAWSLKIFFSELTILYTAWVNGRSAALPALAIQYGDFALWQHQWLQGSMLETHIGYWRAQLQDLPVLELPIDHPRPAIQTYNGAVETGDIPADLLQALRDLSQRESVTLFMLLLATFQMVLSRYSGQQDFALGTPIANRTRTELEGLIGFFANTLVVRADVSGNPTFSQLLARVRETMLAAYEHQEVPFEKVVEALQPERDRRRSPLFQVLFSLHHAPYEEGKMDEVILTPLAGAYSTAKFDLSLVIEERSHGLHYGLEYNTDLFTEETIQRMTQHWRRVLQQVTAHPDYRLANFSLMSEHERLAMFAPVAERPESANQHICLHTLFEAQARLAPDTVALVYKESQVTYAELNHRANQLAHYLRQSHVGPDVLVGLCMERSIELLVGILGILKAGGAYVPLDPAYPPERQSFLMQDAQTPLVLTQQHLLEQLPANEGTRLLCLDADWPVVAALPGNDLALSIPASCLAYVIYTSGSTGKPKGVQVSHANVTRLFPMTWPLFHFGRDDTWTLFHAYAFDFSVWEIWGALLHGGRLLVVPYLVSRAPQVFYQLLAEQGVTVLNQTPSAFAQLSHSEEEASLAVAQASLAVAQASEQRSLALRLVIFGGEALDPRRLRPWVERHGDAHPQLVNMYGITETTVHVTYHRLTEADFQGKRGSVIGVPILDLQVYILDADLNPVPPGVPGEMYVGGAGLARGYLHRPELTSERFIAHPWHSGGSRLYKTGDLARTLPGGEIEHLGRIDEQVKIRGFRIELGEIETVIKQHPQVSDAIVIMREDRPGDKALVAYVIGSDEASLAVAQTSLAVAQTSALSLQDVRLHVEKLLPEYMIPAHFMFLPMFPLTTNGKVDKRALPEPTPATPDTPPLAPRDDLEMLLVDIWQQVLGRSQIGISVSFFHLGGHSLLATQLMSRIHKLLRVDVPLQLLFEAPTIAALALRLTEYRGVKERAALLIKAKKQFQSMSIDQRSALLQQTKHQEENSNG